MKTKIITIANVKGGVGKTSSVAAIGDILARVLNKKVLLIDAATLANLSRRFGYDTVDCEIKVTLDSYLFSVVKERKFMSNQLPAIEPYIHTGILNNPGNETRSEYENLSIICSTPDLDCVYKSVGHGENSIIRAMLAYLKKLERFEYILIDTSPAYNNAHVRDDYIAGSDYLMIPVFASPDSMIGAELLLESYESIVDFQKAHEQPLVNYLGMFFCNIAVNNSDLYKQFSVGKKRFNWKYIFSSFIPQGPSVCQSGNMNMAVTSAFPSSPPSCGYLMLVREMLDRIRKSEDSIEEKAQQTC